MILKTKLRCYIRILAAILFISAGLAAAGCGGNRLPPSASPEMKIAIYARQAVILTDGVLSQLDQMTDLVLTVTPDKATQDKVKLQTVAAAKVAQQVGARAVELADALKAYAAARRTVNGELPAAQKVRDVLKEIQRLLPTILAPIDSAQVRLAVTTTIQSVLDLLTDIGGMLPATT